MLLTPRRSLVPGDNLGDMKMATTHSLHASQVARLARIERRICVRGEWSKLPRVWGMARRLVMCGKM